MSELERKIHDACVENWHRHDEAPPVIRVNPADAVKLAEAWFGKQEDTAAQLDPYFPDHAQKVRDGIKDVRAAGARIDYWVDPCTGVPVPFKVDPALPEGTISLTP